ncbi:MAG TPA: hypothetical protein VFV34_17815 [Blastocatellia bacterium]|nr:hypothetical protein [Blastocatellia bacterium]
MGSGCAIFKPFSAGLGGWWRILIMSDGVWKYVGWDRMVTVGRRLPGRDVADTLREEAVTRSGGTLADDLRIIVLEP